MLFSAIRDIWSAFKEYSDRAMLYAFIAVTFYILITLVKSIYNFITHKRQASIWHILFKVVVFALFGIYCSYVLALTISGRDAFRVDNTMYLDPLASIKNKNNIAVTVLENFIMFVPMGCFIPMLWKYFRGPVRTGAIGFFLSVLIELTQLLTKRGYFDVDDIILNTLGSLFGYFLFAAVYFGLMGIKRRIITDVAKKYKKNPPLGRMYDRAVLRNGYLLFALQMLPALLWSLVIMGFSSDTGDASGNVSKSLLSKLLNIVGIGNATIEKIAGSEELLFYEKVLRKFAHMFEYGVLAVLVWAMFYSIRKLFRILSYLAGFAAAFAVGFIDETNQRGVTGRTGTYKDLVFDCGGAVIFLIATAVIIGIISLHYLRKYRWKNPKKH